jgi:phage baseplate assembly protein W
MIQGDFLGQGWAFPVAASRDRRINTTAAEENIRDSIWIILATVPGERIMRPDFGCGIHNLVFELNDAASAGEVKRTVYDALVRWEPRIDVIEVDVETRGRAEEVLLINIHYRVRSTNNFFNLVYPFYIAGPR